jgi:ribosome-associated protein
MRLAGVSSQGLGGNLDTEALARRAAAIALDMKAQNVVIVDLRSRSTYADFLVIASGTSDRHVQSVAEAVEVTLKKEQVAIVGAEGVREGQWAHIDLGGFVVHIFHQFARDLYDLESLYDKTPRTRLSTEAPAAKARQQLS